MNIYLSLIVPCYNEAEHLEKSFPKVIEVLKKLKKSYEVIIIDDFSNDGTVDIINSLIEKNKKTPIRFIQHKKNVGRGGAVTEGIKLAKGEIVGFIDIDLEVSPNYIPHFLQLLKAKKADIVTGRRFYPFKFFGLQYFIRTLVSVGNSFLVKVIFKFPVNDTETGYKFFNRDKIMPVLEKTQDRHWFWDTEIIIRSFLHGLKVREEPVRFVRSDEKTSTVRLVPDIIKHFKALYLFKSSLLKGGRRFGKLYSFPSLYTFAMKVLFGRNYSIRYSLIAKIIEPERSVVDVCCGDCALYKYLKSKHVDYLGLDISSAFVNRAFKNGIAVRLFDLRIDSIPDADYVILQGSLYQFKNPQLIVKKLYGAARKKLIISETISSNISTRKFSKNALIKMIISSLVNTENNDAFFRFDENSFKEILSAYNPNYVKAGKDLIAAIDKD